MKSIARRRISRLLLIFVTIGIGAACRQSPQDGAGSTPTASATATASVIMEGTPAAAQTQAPAAEPTTPTRQPLPPAAPTRVPSPTPTATPQYPPYTGRPLERDNIGIQVHIHREDLDEIFAHVETLDIGWVKVQISWKLYQSQPDSYVADRLAELDALVEKASANEIKVLLSVSKAPEWSRPTTELDGPPSDFALFEDFMTVLAGRYAGRVAAYELWNEPNLQREWNGAALDAADVTRLMAAGARGVRVADPEAVVISGAPATTGINDGIVAIDDRVFLRAMLEAGIGDHVDGIGMHPYGWANPPLSSFASPDPSVATHNDHPSFFFLNTIDDYEALLTEYNVERPLWVTEFGWGSFDKLVDDDGEPAFPPSGAEFMTAVSEWQQANYLLDALEYAQGDSRIALMIIWNLNFGPLLGPEYSETGYSILRPDGERRAAYRSLEHAKKT